jgi:hypothetical protein
MPGHVAFLFFGRRGGERRNRSGNLTTQTHRLGLASTWRHSIQTWTGTSWRRNKLAHVLIGSHEDKVFLGGGE